MEDLVDGSLFDDLGLVHHDYAIGDLSDHAHVVGDEHYSGTGFNLKLFYEAQDLSLDSHIEGSGGLVSDQQPWAAS